MSFCQDWSLVKARGHDIKARPLYCRSWKCIDCAPRRKKALIQQARAGRPTKFITLTVNPEVGSCPLDRARQLARAWRLIVKRFKRLFPGETMQYLAVFERTKAGEPHLHIIARCRFIDQKWLSNQMKELMGAPIVDIRACKGRRQVARYVTKYIGKDPNKFGTLKRYWTSQGWEKKTWHRDDDAPDGWTKWLITQKSVYQIEREYPDDVWSVKWENDTLIALYRAPP